MVRTLLLSAACARALVRRSPARLPRRLLAASAPTVVFIHGMHCQGCHFDLWRERFEAAGIVVAAPTLRHHGVAPPPAALGEATLDDYADDVAAVVDALPAPPVLVGHSMGGIVALKLLARGVGSGAALVAPAAPANWTTPVTPEQLFIWHGVVLGWPFRRPVALRPWPARGVRGRAFPGKRASVRCWRAREWNPLRFAGWGFFNRLPADAPERRAAERALGAESGRAALEMLWRPLAFLFNGGRRTTAVVDADRVAQPVSIYGGSRDRATPARHHRRIRDRLGAPYTLYPDMGHWLLAEPGWEDVADDVIAWVRAVDEGEVR